MENSKHFTKSLTLWGALVTLLSGVFQQLNIVTIHPDEQQQLIDLGMQLWTIAGEAVGVLMVVIGRFRAKKPISTK